MDHYNSNKNSEFYIQKGPMIPYMFDINILYSGREKCDPLHYAGPCCKGAYLLHVILDGKGIYKCNGKEYSLKKGQMFMILPQDNIFYQADKDDPWEYVWVRFEGNYFEFLLSNTSINQRTFTLSDEQFKYASGIFSTLLDSMDDDLAPYLRATGHFYVFLGWFLNQFGKKIYVSEGKMSFMKLVNYINMHYTENISMDKLESIAHYSRSHTYKLFMRHLGCSPKEYVNSLRLRKSCELLLETKLSAKEVGEKVGYNSYVGFIKAFKKKYNILPSDYRSSANTPEGEK